jgi:hypothetical protein
MAMSSSHVWPNAGVINLLHRRKDEREKLMEQMDICQAEFDRLSVNVADKQTELAAKQREFGRIRKIREAREFAPIPARVDNRGCPDSVFNPEHLAWIKDKRSVIAELYHTVNQIEADTELEDEVDFLRQNVAILQSQSANLQKVIQRSYSKRRKCDEECQTCRIRRKETSNQMRAYRNVAKDAEAVRAGLLTRKVAVEAASSPSSGLPSILANLQRELDTIAGEIEGLDEQVRDYEKQTSGVKLPTREQNRTADWMQGMDEDLTTIEAAVSTRKTDLDENLKAISRLEKRYLKLSSFVKARKKKGTGDDTVVTEMEIDDLLKRLPKEEPSPDVQARLDMEAMAENNRELEIQMTNLQKELNHKVQMFAVEEARMMKQIHKEREQCFEREKQIQDEIQELKLNMAQKIFK